jgi:hypothetical protein
MFESFASAPRSSDSVDPVVPANHAFAGSPTEPEEMIQAAAPRSRHSLFLQRTPSLGQGLQLIHDAGACLHHAVPVPQQLPHIPVLATRHPDLRKVILYHAFQNQLCILSNRSSVCVLVCSGFRPHLQLRRPINPTTGCTAHSPPSQSIERDQETGPADGAIPSRGKFQPGRVLKLWCSRNSPEMFLHHTNCPAEVGEPDPLGSSS